MLYVFDIDGTIADLTHRLHHIKDAPKDWNAFFEGCKDDEPIHAVLRLAKELVNSPHIDVEFWTGRPERCRVDTMAWLKRHGIFVTPAELRMRKDGDFRPDYEVKAEYLDLCVGTPTLIFEDRAPVVEMWRSKGLHVAQVAEGNY